MSRIEIPRNSTGKSAAMVPNEAFLTVARLHALARIATWGLPAWCNSDRGGPISVLGDPSMSALNSRTVNALIQHGLLRVTDSDVVVTPEGHDVLERNAAFVQKVNSAHSR